MQQASEIKSMPYTYTLPTSVSFTGKGLLGYIFGPLHQGDLDVYYVEVEKGHDTFMVSKKIARTYYVLSGSGYFTINNAKHDVCSGMLVDVPPKVEYTLTQSGRKLIPFIEYLKEWVEDLVASDPGHELHEQNELYGH